MTIVELAIAMVLFGLLSAVLLGLTAGTQKLTGQNDTRLDQINTGRVAVEAMSRTLRTAVLPTQLGATCTDPSAVTVACATAAFVFGTATSVQFYANIDNENNAIGPSRVTYIVTGGNLVETIQRPDSHAVDDFNYSYCAPSASCPIRTRTLATGVQTAVPVFGYFEDSGASIMDATLNDVDLANVDSIEVTLRVQRPARDVVPAATFIQRIALPNADSVIRNDN